MPSYVVATVNEIAPGGRKIVEIAGRSIGVFNVGGQFYALRNRCPHQGGPLCEGRLTGFLVSSGPGEYRYSRPGEILRCPWHGWEFDLRTGQSWFDPVQVRVRRYDVTVELGSALIGETGGETGTGDVVPPAVPGTTPAEVAASADPNAVSPTEPGMEGMQPGPYVAETFPVVVEQQYVIVEIGR